MEIGERNSIKTKFCRDRKAEATAGAHNKIQNLLSLTFFTESGLMQTRLQISMNIAGKNFEIDARVWV